LTQKPSAFCVVPQKADDSVFPRLARPRLQDAKEKLNKDNDMRSEDSFLLHGIGSQPSSQGSTMRRRRRERGSQTRACADSFSFEAPSETGSSSPGEARLAGEYDSQIPQNLQTYSPLKTHET